MKSNFPRSNGVRLVTQLDLGQPHSEMILDLDILLVELLLDAYEQSLSKYNLSLQTFLTIKPKMLVHAVLSAPMGSLLGHGLGLDYVRNYS